MWRTSFLIWFTTNVVMAVILLFYLGFEVGSSAFAIFFFAFFITIIFSLPVVPLIGLLFGFINNAKLEVSNAWFSYIVSITAFVTVPVILFSFFFTGGDLLSNELLPFFIIALISAYVGSLIHCTSIHKNFLKHLDHEK